MTSRRRARRTTKEDSSSFFVGGGEHRPAAWSGESARSSARSQRRRCSNAHVFVQVACYHPRGDSIHAHAYVHALSSPPPPPSSPSSQRALSKWPDASLVDCRSLRVSADHVTMKTHRSVTDRFDCFRIHDEDRQFLSVISMTSKTIRSEEEREWSIIFPRIGGGCRKPFSLPPFLTQNGFKNR